MRHRHGYNRLGRDPIHRRALLRNLAIALVKHERIVTTLAKAKELRRTGDKMIGFAKKDTVHSRKKAWNWLQHPDLMAKLFGPLRERYLDRPGGYTRVLRGPNRKGDNAPMAVVELVDNRFPPLRAGRDSLRAPLPAYSQIEKDMLAQEELLSSSLCDLELNAADVSVKSDSDSTRVASEPDSNSMRVASGKVKSDSVSTRFRSWLGLNRGNKKQTAEDFGTPV